MVGSLEIYNKVNKDFKTNTDPEPHFMQKSEINTEISKRGREERIKQIREILHQEVDTEFDNPTKGYDVRILAKQKRIQKEIEDILKLESITEPEKYKEIVDMIQELQIEIDKSHLDQDGKLYTIEVELEKLEKIKHIIDQEIRDLRIYFEKIDDNIEQIQVNKHILPIQKTSLNGFKEKIDNFITEFGKIKTEGESAAFSYLDKVKDLIDEGEEHIKDIDAKIPKDLRTVKEDIRKRYIKLKFMISEYYRDHNAKTDTRNQIKDYLEKSSKSLKRLANVNLATDDDAEIKKLEDEKQILSSMIKRVKNEIAITHNGSENMLDRLKKIYELSADNKFNLLEYYNKLETL